VQAHEVAVGRLPFRVQFEHGVVNIGADYGIGVITVDVGVGEGLHSVVQGFGIYFQHDCEALPVPLLDLLGCAEAFKPAVDLDGDLGAEGLGFLHRVRRHHQGRLPTLLPNRLPKSPARIRIDSS